MALAFLIVPLVELVLIFVLAHYIGWLTTLGLTALSSVVGAYLAKKSWSGWWGMVRDEWSREGFPVHRLGEGALLIVSIAFMITPGPLTGLIGLAFLIPGVRSKASQWIVKWASSRIMSRFWR